MPDDQTTHAPHIPDAVRRASQRADELAREAGILNVPPAEETPELPEPTGEDVATVVEPPEQQLVEPAPSEPSPTQPAQPDWEQRYNTLQGKYNAEIPELRGQLTAMQQLIASMQAQPRASEPPTRETRFSLPQRDVPQEDIEAYGQDLVHGVQRWSKLAIEPELSELRHRLVQLEGGVQQQASMTAVQRTEAGLDRALPEWRTMNLDPGFIAWINQADPFSGKTRKVLADEAYAAGDVGRTLAFFQAYNNEHTAVRQPPGIQSGQTEQSADRLPLVDLAVPGRGQVAAPPTPGAPQRRIWTGADITSFYRQKQRGVWEGREAEVARIEADIYAAQHEGRIRQ